MRKPPNRLEPFRPGLSSRPFKGLLAVLLLGLGLVATQSLSASADSRMPVSIEPQAPSVASGEYLTYNAFVGCSIPDGCKDAVFTFTKPPGASGPGVVAQPYPPGVTSVTVLPNGDVQVTFDVITVGSTKQLVVSWPTVNQYTAPGAQPVTMTGTASNATSPSTASTTMDLTAKPKLTINKTGPTTVAPDSVFEYHVDIANDDVDPNVVRGELAIENGTIVDHLPAGLVFVSATSGGTYDAASNTVTWILNDSNPDIPGRQFVGPAGYLVRVKAPSGLTPPLEGATLVNTATVSGTPFGGGPVVSATDDAPVTIGVGPGAPVAAFQKTAATTVGNGQSLTYKLVARNAGDAPGVLTVTDTLPAGFSATSIANVAPVGDSSVVVDYADGTSATFTIPATAPTTVSIAKAGTTTSKVTITSPSLAPGQTMAYNMVGQVNAPDGTTTIHNCATAAANATSAQSCFDTTITKPQIAGFISKSTDQAPVNPGGIHTWTIHYSDAQGYAPMNPQIIDLLPNQLAFVPGSLTTLPSAGDPDCPAASEYTVTLKPNLAIGRDAVVFTLPPGTSFNPNCDFTFQTRVKPGVPSGTYTGSAAGNQVTLMDANDAPNAYATGVDVNDLDQDGSTTDPAIGARDNFAIAESSAAEVVKSVQGDQDGGWLGSAEVAGQADQVGHSDIGGTVDWKLKMGNQGNRNLTNLVTYDLLPDPASPGVTDGRYDDTKPYQWVPTMAGPIDAGGAPVTILYSTKTDPCRPEMDATHGSAPFWCGGDQDPSFVPAASVADWSTIKSIRFDFGDHVFPAGEYFTFAWTMDVPTVAAGGGALTDGLQTWNKTAVQADRANPDGTTLPLLPAEAPWVEDIIRTLKPTVEIVKTDAAGHDADTQATGVEVAPGDPTALKFTITNDGNEPLTDVEVTDKVTLGSATVSGLTCDFSALGGPSAGTAWAGPFQPDDTFGCTATLSGLAVGDPHTDVATITGTGQYSGTPVSDDNPFNAATPTAYAIGDFTWKDLDADGIQDSGEPPVGGVVVTLTDASGNPVTDLAGNPVGPTATDVNGYYHFDDLAKGSYIVTFTAPAGYAFTDAAQGSDPKVDSNANVTTGKSAVVDLGPSDNNLTDSVPGDHVTAPKIDRTIDAGIVVGGTPDITIVKKDAAGNDADTDGTAVTVGEGKATTLAFTVTNWGNEALKDVKVGDTVTAGDATVTGLSCTFPDGSTGTSWDGPFAPGAHFPCSATLSALTPGVAHADLGQVTGVGQYSGTPVDDTNPYHAETPATPDVTIVKQDAAGHDADTTDDAVTVPKGHTTALVFTITNSGTEPLTDVKVSDEVTKGSGTVSGLSCDFSALGGPSTGTTWAGPFKVGDHFGCTATLSALTPGELHTDVATVDGTGAYTGTPVTDDNPYNAETAPVYAIGDYVWHDTDKDGIQDQGEAPVEGVKVTLTDAAGNPVTDADGNTVEATHTDVDGYYHFDVLPAGSYVVTFTAPDGYEFTQALAGTDPKVDSDANVTTGKSAVVELGAGDANLAPSVPGDHVTAPNIDRTIDAGIVVSGTPEVTIVKTDAAGHDADTADDAVSVPNGTTTALVFTITNSGTEPLADVKVTDEVTKGSATVSDLSCDFSALGGPATGTTWAGPFKVGDHFGCTATLSALEPGTSHTDVASVSGAGQYSGTAVTDTNPYNNDTPPLVSVGDHVWFDTNRDGLQSPGEKPVEGVTVNLYDASGNVVATTTTDADGFYSFTDLTASTEYQIGFVAPAGTSFTTALAGTDTGVDSDANLTTGRTTVFTTPATGENSATSPDDPTWDAGLVQIDLTIAKVLDTKGPFERGDTVTFTLTPHNNGPVDALAGWSVTEVVPSGLTLVSMAGDGYDCDVETATCTDTTGTNLGVDADGGPITVTTKVKPNATGTIHNVTYVRPADGDIVETNPLVVPTTDTDTSTSATNNDDQASLTVTVVPPPSSTTTTQPTDVSNGGQDNPGTTVARTPHATVSNGNRARTGSLPRTGSDPAPLLEVGGILGLGGLGLVLVARRRRKAVAA